MKILVVSNMYPSEAYPSYGVFVRNFCRGLEQSGIGYDLAVMRRGSNKLQKLLGYLSFYAGSFFKSLFGRYDLVYVHYASHSSPPVLLARKLRKFPIYTNCHGSDVLPQNPRQEKMQKYTCRILALSQKVVVPSEYFRQVVGEKYGIPKENIAVCASGGVNAQVFYPRAQRVPPFTMGFVSRIEPGKGWDVLLKACTLLPDQNYRLLMIGGGSEESVLRSAVQHLGLEQQVSVLGALPQEELPRYLNQMDVFVFPTQLAESLGLVALEAMACGVPVICSNFAAPADYVEDGVNGFQFALGDPLALKEAICRCMDADRKTLGENALKTAQGYRTETVYQTMKTILTQQKDKRNERR